MPATALIKLLGLANQSYCTDHFPWTTDLHIFPGTNALLVSFLDPFPRTAEYKNHKRFLLLNIGNFSLKVRIFCQLKLNCTIQKSANASLEMIYAQLYYIKVHIKMDPAKTQLLLRVLVWHCRKVTAKIIIFHCCRKCNTI